LPKDYPRARRIADQIQRELSSIIRSDLRDPRAGMITLTDVLVSPDHATATVFFTVLGEAGKADDTAVALDHASGFLRTQLARRMKIRTVPQLRFRYDTSVERGVRLSHLIDDAVASGKRSPDT
jgi:ribosome-binding factor A